MPLPGTFHGPLPPQTQPTYGHKPTVTKSVYGGGPSVGLDYNRPQGFVQQQQAKPQPASHPSPRKAAPADPMMLNRVQESLQHSIGYQPVQSPQTSFAATPVFQQSAPPFQTQTSQQSPAPGQYQQPSPTYQTQISSPFSQPEPQAAEDDYEFVPVWERRKAFLADDPKG